MRARTAQVQKLKTADKALRLLELLVTSGREMGVGELAVGLGTNPATAYRLLRTLEEHHFARRNDATARYQAGYKILELGEALLDGLDLRAMAHPHLEELSRRTKETVHLMVPDGTMGVYLDRVESPQRVRVASNVGRREWLHCSAVGKAILAHLPEETLEAVITNAGLPQVTPRTITERPELNRELARIRARGYAIDDMEGEDAVRCVGASILDRHRKVIGAISVAAPASRMTLSDLHKIAHLVMATTDHVSSSLGQLPPVADGALPHNQRKRPRQGGGS